MIPSLLLSSTMPALMVSIRSVVSVPTSRGSTVTKRTSGHWRRASATMALYWDISSSVGVVPDLLSQSLPPTTMDIFIVLSGCFELFVDVTDLPTSNACYIRIFDCIRVDVADDRAAHDEVFTLTWCMYALLLRGEVGDATLRTHNCGVLGCDGFLEPGIGINQCLQWCG